MRRLSTVWVLLACGACHGHAGPSPVPVAASQLVGRWIIVFEGGPRAGVARARTSGQLVFLRPPTLESPMPSRLRIDFRSIAPAATGCYDRGGQTVATTAAGDSVWLLFTREGTGHCSLEGIGHWHGTILIGEWHFDGEMSRMAVGRFWMNRASE